MAEQVGTVRWVRSVLLLGVLATPAYGPCSRAPRADNHLTRAPARVQRTELPSAVVLESEHAFGTMDADSQGTHDFSIRNGGTSPLALSGSPSPDQAVHMELLQPSVAPGEMGAVRVTWNTRREIPAFARSVTVQTNDPFCKTVELKVSGRVRATLAAVPGEFDLGELDPRDTASVTATTTVFSQFWREFALEVSDCSLPGATWTVAPADAKTLKENDATCGYRLTVTSPADRPRGRFQGQLQLRGTRSVEGGVPETETLNLSIAGRVLRRLALYGEAIQEDESLLLGCATTGQELRIPLLMKIRDPEPEFKIASLHVKPEFLKVVIERLPDAADGRGLYQFEIVIPPDAPPCEYLGVQAGEIHLKPDHPRLEDLDMKVYFAVRPRR